MIVINLETRSYTWSQRCAIRERGCLRHLSVTEMPNLVEILSTKKTRCENWRCVGPQGPCGYNEALPSITFFGMCNTPKVSNVYAPGKPNV